jgi:tetraacyldisaccharide-1-P 4'-kinase
MRAKLEDFFQREWQLRSRWQIVLQPLSWLFWLLSATRRRLFSLGVFRATQARVPVIVVGNITVGGTGKTPAVLALVTMLKSAGMKPGIVTRGYAKPARNPPPGTVIHVVPPTPYGFSDEAMLLAQRSGVPVMVGANRVAAIDALLTKHSDVNIIISDDGLQHYAMGRDIEIAVVGGFGNGYLQPAGPLREGAWRLATVDAIILNNTNKDGDFQAKMAETARQTGILNSDMSPNENALRQAQGERQGSNQNTVRGELVEPHLDANASSETNALRQAQGERRGGSQKPVRGELVEPHLGTNASSETNALRQAQGERRGADVPVFAMTYSGEQFSSVCTTNTATTTSLNIAAFTTQTNHKKIAAVAGIGNPERFFTHLERLGIALHSRHAFGDHHAYQASDLSAIDADIILMTEKDAVKCVSFADARLWQMQITAILPDTFYDFIQQKINHVARPKIA